MVNKLRIFKVVDRDIHRLSNLVRVVTGSNVSMETPVDAVDATESVIQTRKEENMMRRKKTMHYTETLFFSGSIILHDDFSLPVTLHCCHPSFCNVDVHMSAYVLVLFI